jgi:uncharacterized protein YndB with AHSA1/START domain
MTTGNSIELEADSRSIIAVREFDAPRDLVFSVWTDPKHLAQWWGPNGFTTTTSSFDMRPGGVWRFVMHGPDGRDYQNRITYEDIVPPQRIVYRHGGGEDVEPVRFTTTVTFEDVGGKTRITMRMDFPSAAERERVIREYGADKGLAQTLGRLEQHVAAVSGAARKPLAEREITITRSFDAPRALVFKAWTDAKMLAQWWGPKGFTNPRCEFDARVGGVIRIDMRAPDGAIYPMQGEVREIVPPERLVFTNNALDVDGNPIIQGLTTVIFAEEGGKTELTLHTRGIAVAELAVKYLQGMEYGWGQSIDKLADLLAHGA